MNATPLAGTTVASGAIINAAVAYTSTTGTYVVFRGDRRRLSERTAPAA